MIYAFRVNSTFPRVQNSAAHQNASQARKRRATQTRQGDHRVKKLRNISGADLMKSLRRN